MSFRLFLARMVALAHAIVAAVRMENYSFRSMQARRAAGMASPAEKFDVRSIPLIVRAPQFISIDEFSELVSPEVINGWNEQLWQAEMVQVRARAAQRLIDDPGFEDRFRAWKKANITPEGKMIQGRS